MWPRSSPERREQRTTARQHLREGLALPIENLTDRENRDFLVAAHALSLEQSGQIGPAMLRLAEILPRGPEMTLTHQWLPEPSPAGAHAAGDRQLARTAANACAEEATSETPPARAAAASLRCRGLLESDPDPLAEAAAPTGRSARRRNCPPRWKTWLSCWPGGAMTTMRAPP